jgi:hypothetical protein
MSYSQFDDVLSFVTEAPTPTTTIAGGDLQPGHIWFKVGGPLGVDPTVRYEMPIVISWALIQSPANGSRKPEDALRTSGVVEVIDPRAKDWSDIVQLDVRKFRAGPARAVAVLAVQQVSRYGFETLTWCDHVELKVA